MKKMEIEKHLIEIISIGLALMAAIFTYYNFFREGRHRQRIEFDIDFKNLGLNKKFRVIEIGAIAENKGNVSQKFESIRLRVRGIIDNIDLEEIKNYEPRLAFPESFYPKDEKKHPSSEKKIELIPKLKNENNYFFVRPGVKQRFPIVLKIPENWTIIHIRFTFKYKGTGEIHPTERAFQIDQN